MRVDLATAYVGSIDEAALRREVEPVHYGRRTMWLKEDLDRFVDSLRANGPDREREENPWNVVL